MNLNSDELSVLRRLSKGRTSSVDRQTADNLQELGLVGRVEGVSMVYRITPAGADALTDAEVYAIPLSELLDQLEALTGLVGRHGAAIIRRAAERIKDAETLLELDQIALTRADKMEAALRQVKTGAEYPDGLGDIIDAALGDDVNPDAHDSHIGTGMAGAVPWEAE